MGRARLLLASPRDGVAGQAGQLSPEGAGRAGWTSQPSSATSSSATPRPTAPGPNGWPGNSKRPATPRCCRPGTCRPGPPSCTPWTRPSSTPATPCWCCRRPTCARRWPRRTGAQGSKPTQAARRGGWCRCGWRPASRRGCWPTGSCLAPAPRSSHQHPVDQLHLAFQALVGHGPGRAETHPGP
jgi:hypothetical protein